MSEMKKWTMTCDVSGRAWCQVEANSYEEAIETAKKAGDWSLQEWELDWLDSDYNVAIDANEVK